MGFFLGWLIGASVMGAIFGSVSGRGVGLGILLSVLLGPIGWVLIFLFPKPAPVRNHLTHKLCIWCQSDIPRRASVCGHCGRDQYVQEPLQGHPLPEGEQVSELDLLAQTTAQMSPRQLKTKIRPVRGF
jgi:ribosomal protein L40E